MIDVVTVVHNDTNTAQAEALRQRIAEVEETSHAFILVDNSVNNRGFAKGCNWGALHPEAKNPIIGFLNPDVLVDGPFMEQVIEALKDPQVVITGCRFNKPANELAIWGVNDWVCGATFFVRRGFFAAHGGFDESYVWAWEETDLIRTAESEGLRCRSIDLPLRHDSPIDDSPDDARYKQQFFTQGQQRFAAKWARPSQRARVRPGRRR